MSFGAQIILPLKNIATGRDIAEFAPLAHIRRPEGGWRRWRWFWNTDQLFCSYPRVTNDYFSRISVDKVWQSGCKHIDELLSGGGDHRNNTYNISINHNNHHVLRDTHQLTISRLS
jgi:hypothetical protein